MKLALSGISSNWLLRGLSLSRCFWMVVPAGVSCSEEQRAFPPDATRRVPSAAYGPQRLASVAEDLLPLDVWQE